MNHPVKITDKRAWKRALRAAFCVIKARRGHHIPHQLRQVQLRRKPDGTAQLMCADGYTALIIHDIGASIGADELRMPTEAVKLLARVPLKHEAIIQYDDEAEALDVWYQGETHAFKTEWKMPNIPLILERSNADITSRAARSGAVKVRDLLACKNYLRTTIKTSTGFPWACEITQFVTDDEGAQTLGDCYCFDSKILARVGKACEALGLDYDASLLTFGLQDTTASRSLTARLSDSGGLMDFLIMPMITKGTRASHPEREQE